jgi:hypothetical protein
VGRTGAGLGVQQGSFCCYSAILQVSGGSGHAQTATDFWREMVRSVAEG